jgi:hypothetical protein
VRCTCTSTPSTIVQVLLYLQVPLSADLQKKCSTICTQVSTAVSPLAAAHESRTKKNIFEQKNINTAHIFAIITKHEIHSGKNIGRIMAMLRHNIIL